MSEVKKKLGFVGCIALGIGAIVGAGIFGSLPTVLNSIGPGVIWALVAAIFVVVFRSISRAYSNAAVPTSASSFMHGTKLIHPYVGFLQTINYSVPILVPLYAVLFAMYLGSIFPDGTINTTLVALLVIGAFTIMAFFGNHSSAFISNAMVVLLLAVIAMFVILGIPQLDPDKISFGAVVKPGITVTAFSAAVALLTSALSGASTLAEISDDIKNPTRNVPLALLLCPIIVGIIYIAMAIVALGTPGAQFESLTGVAKNFMSPGLVIFFILGGPICAILTSMIPVALSSVATIDYNARLRVYPEILSRQNKHGVAYFSLIIVALISAAIVGTGLTFGAILTIFSFVNTFAELTNTVVPISALKKYPKSCEHSIFNMPKPLVYFFSIANFLIGIYLCYQLLLTMDLKTNVFVIGSIVVGYIYFAIRVNYLKKKEGYDLIAELQKPDERWIERELELSKN